MSKVRRIKLNNRKNKIPDSLGGYYVTFTECFNKASLWVWQLQQILFSGIFQINNFYEFTFGERFLTNLLKFLEKKRF